MKSFAKKDLILKKRESSLRKNLKKRKKFKSVKEKNGSTIR